MILSAISKIVVTKVLCLFPVNCLSHVKLLQLLIVINLLLKFYIFRFYYVFGQFFLNTLMVSIISVVPIAIKKKN